MDVGIGVVSKIPVVQKGGLLILIQSINLEAAV